MTFCDGCLSNKSPTKHVQLFLDGSNASNGALSFDLCVSCQQRLATELPKMVESFRPREVKQLAGLTPDQAAKVEAYYAK